jgi:hypothetical protein
LYNTGKAITLESAINKSIKIKNFAEWKHYKLI